MITRIDKNILIHNRVVYLSNIVPTTHSSIDNQTLEVLDTIDKNLKCSGSSKNDMLIMTVYLANMKDRDTIKVIIDKWTNGSIMPTIIGSVLYDPLWKLEVAVTAAIPYVFESTNYGLHDINYIV